MSEHDGIEDLKQGLYSRKEKEKIDPSARTPLSPFSGNEPSVDGIRKRTSGRIISGKVEGGEEEDAPVAVAPVPKEKEPVNFASMRKNFKSRPTAPIFLWGSFIFFLGAAAVAAFTFFGGGNTISPSNIDLQIVAPPLVDSGKPVNIEYIVDNHNNTTLVAADLIITYPDGTRSADNSADLPRERLTIGDVASNAQLKQTSSAIFFGQEGSVQKISVTLEYQIKSSNAIFVKQGDINFTIGSSPVSILVDTPKEAISGQGFDMAVTVQSNTTSPIDNVALSGQYPFGYVVSNSNPSADAGGTFWRLGTLEAGSSKVIHLHGTLTGEDGDERVFHFSVGSQPDQTGTKLKTTLLSIPQSMTVTKPFIAARILIDGNSESPVAEPLGKKIDGQVAWQNNLSDPISNLTLSLSLAGTAIDPSSISGSGFYDSSKNAIIWSSTQDSTLATVAPGAAGNFQFSFATLPPSSSGVITNPKAMLKLTVQATRQGNSNVPENISSAAQTEIDFASAVSLTAEALHFTGPFTNSGPMPPKVNQKTTYAVAFTVKNSSNTIAGAQVQATLPPYVEYVAASQNGENLSYDSASRTITWNLGDLKAGVGYGLAERQGVFEVALTPSTSQIDKAPELTSSATFSGQDRFAQAGVTATANPPTTQLIGEQGFSPTMSSVVP